mgnify:CR=1 FL=1
MLTEGKQRVRLAAGRADASAEAGLPGLTIYSWQGLAGPAGMPPDVVRKVRAESQQGAWRIRRSSNGSPRRTRRAVGGTPDEFAALVRDELRRWAEADQGQRKVKVE